jgi:RNA polymerase sigma factor (sigma-70 family)
MARRHAELEGVPSTEAGDADLTVRAAGGDTGAFEELYRRHSAAAWRVGYAVTGNASDASDAVSEAFTKVFTALPAGRFPSEAPFRPYLMTATRNAAIDGLRRSGRAQPTDIDNLDLGTSSSTPPEAVLGALDSSLVATAFLSLPERWRSVLWLTEVEGMKPREVATMLGVSANGAAQLAVRARSRLREQFLQAHLRESVDGDCRFTVEHLGAYVGGGLAARDVATVDQHLEGCDACRARRAELEDVGSTLRKIAIPVPLALGAATLAKWHAMGTVVEAAHHGWRGVAGVVRASRPLAVASGLTLALGIIGAALITPPQDSNLSAPSRQAPRQQGGATPVVQGFSVLPPIAVASIETVDQVAAQQAALGAVIAASRPPTSGGPGGGGNAPSPPSPAPPAEPATPVVQVTVGAANSSVGAGAGVGDNSCTGLQLVGAVLGCNPPTDDGAVLNIQTGGFLGDNNISI